jgi:hypothetical protein
MDDDGLLETLRCIVGEDTPDATLRALLLRANGDVTAAANSFFDGGANLNLTAPQPSSAAASSVNDDVLGTLFKTLEDQGKKLAGMCVPWPRSSLCPRRPQHSKPFDRWATGQPGWMAARQPTPPHPRMRPTPDHRARPAA